MVDYRRPGWGSRVPDMFQLGDRFPLTKATSCVRLIPIKLRALVLVQICNREAVMRTNISTDPGKRPRLLGELGELSHRRVRSAEYKYGRGAEIFGAEEPADYLYQVIEGAVRSYKLLSDGRRQIGAFHLAGDIFGLERRKSHVSVGTQDLTRTRGGVSSRNGSSPDTSGYHSPPNESPGYCGLPWAHTGDRIASSFRPQEEGLSQVPRSNTARL